MAHTSPAVQEAFLGSRFMRYTPDTITDPAQMRRTLAEIRQRGYAVSVRAVVEPSSGVAVPIAGPTGDVLASLGIVVPVGEENVPHTVPLLRAAAAHITAAVRAVAPTLTSAPN